MWKDADFAGTENVGAALCFYKALKVYPTPSDLISIYDRTGKFHKFSEIEFQFFPIIQV